MEKKNYKELILNAFEALKYSYSPYSQFKVGAALLTKEGLIYRGSNIENAAYSASVCAERTVITKAISEGYKEFFAIAIVGGLQGNITDFCPPCGVCRQVMMEFCDKEQFQIVLAKSIEEYRIYTLEELMPLGFGPSNVLSR